MELFGLLRFALVGFVSLLVVVDPFGLVPIFSGLTPEMTGTQRSDVLRRAVLIALGIALFFLLAGHAALAAIGVSVNAFAISGGILLFVTAFPMLFGQRAGLQSAERRESPTTGDDIAVFPLAIPLLSGPGALTSILLLADLAHGEWRRVAALIVAVVAVFAVSYVALRFGTLLLPRIGDRGAHILTRVLGLVTAALAVQYVLNGVTGYYHGLVAGGH